MRFVDVDFGGNAFGFGMEAEEDCFAFCTAESVTLSVSDSSGVTGSISSVDTVEGNGGSGISSFTFATDSGGGRYATLNIGVVLNQVVKVISGLGPIFKQHLIF